MNNIPAIKLGVVAVSRDCFPMSLSESRRVNVCKAYREKYGELFECPTVVENEKDMLKALDEVNAADVNALVVYLGNFGPESSEVLLAKKFGGKGFAIAAIIISLISTFVFCSAIAVCVKLYPDFRYFALHEQQIIEEYHENGTIPEQFEKYNAPRYNKYWTAFGCKDFNEFFGKIIDNFASETDESSSDRSYDGYDGNDGEYDDEFDLGVKDLAFSVYYPY